jgi:hypothetical protein
VKGELSGGDGRWGRGKGEVIRGEHVCMCAFVYVCKASIMNPVNTV